MGRGAWSRLLFAVCGSFIITTILIYLPSSNNERERRFHSGHRPRLPNVEPINAYKDPSSRRVLAARRFGDADDGPTPWPQRDTGAHDNLKREFENYDFTRQPPPDAEIISRIAAALDNYERRYGNQSECSYNETLVQYFKRVKKTAIFSSGAMDNWDRFYEQIGTCDLYRNETLIDELLHDIATLPIKQVEQMDGGTQIKLILTFSNDRSALMKPMRFGRMYETDPNHFYFGDFERHTAEIASYHLDKVLGFRRAVPTVGRVVNISSDLWAHAEKKLARTFFVSPAKNLCFVGKCDYYCDTTHAICGMPDLKEGSLQVFLPDEDIVPRKHFRSLYRRTYSKRDQIAVWQRDQSYCEWRVKQKPVYAHGRRLLDLIDMHILDFLMGAKYIETLENSKHMFTVNQDRHHFEQIMVFDDRDIYPLHFDNGRGFGKTQIDFDDVLSPLTQCCLTRPSTARTLLRYYAGPGPTLTEALHRSLSKDPVAPILPPKHYPAIERRLGKIIRAIDKCLSERGAENVLRVVYKNPRVPPPNAPEANKDEEEDD